MKSQLSRWSALVLISALFPVLGLTCANDSEEIASGETGSEEFRAGDKSLPGSKFEIDSDANLKQDAPNAILPSLDWASVDYLSDKDDLSGKGDSSYKGGAKEDDACPLTGKGSIPNNKSDIKWFGAYEESGNPGFLHLFWTRVQDPSGTTLIDFEFNQSETLCADGIHRNRTVGDFLLEYRLEQGGAFATIKKREWNGNAWGGAVDLTGATATGTINDSTIPTDEADGLEELDPRTFGEASIRLDAFFGNGKCKSFPSAIVKSRSADAFDSALKDFSHPLEIDISNCGRVIMRKATIPASDHETVFGFSHTLKTDPGSAETFNLLNDGEATFTSVLLNDNKPPYTVTEDAPAPESYYELDSIECTNTGVDDVVTDKVSRKVTFTIDDASDVLDCTFTNKRKALTDITVTVHSQIDGATSSTITCDELPVVPTDIHGNGKLERTGLLEGLYSCTVDVKANQ